MTYEVVCVFVGERNRNVIWRCGGSVGCVWCWSCQQPVPGPTARMVKFMTLRHLGVDAFHSSCAWVAIPFGLLWACLTAGLTC